MRSIRRGMFCWLFLVIPGVHLTMGPCYADLTVSAETVTTAPGGSGFVQILLKNDFATDQSLSGFSVELSLGGTGVSFTAVDDQTTPAYVFDGVGTGTLTFDLFPNHGFIESDVNLPLGGSVSLVAGQTYGLGRIAYSVEAGVSSGLRAITFQVGPTTQFIDGSNQSYADTDLKLVTGGIQVQGGVAAVPEPSTLTVWLAAGVLACGVPCWRRRALPT